MRIKKTLSKNKTLLLLAFTTVIAKAQIGTLIDSDRSYLKLSVSQAINLGKPALQLGYERGIGKKTTFSGELGWIMNYGFDKLPTDRKNGKGAQAFAEVRYFPFGLSNNNVKIYFGLGTMFRLYNFDAELWAGMGVPENGSYYDARFYQFFNHIKYKTTTTGLNLNVGMQTSLSDMVVLDLSAGFGPRYHHVQHSLKHSLNFVLEDFNSPFVTPSNKGNYMRAGMLLQASIGFKIN